MKFKSLLLLLGAASLLLTGCVNSTVQSKPVSITKIEQNVTKNQTTLSDLRAMLGTPFVIGKTKDDHKKVAGFMLRTSSWANKGKNFAKHMLTFGFGSKATPYVIKNAIFKFDDNDVVTDYAFNGYSFIIKHRMSFWNEAQRELTDERILRILKEGHEIGLHSFCHDYGKIYSSADSFLCDLNEEQSWISSVTGKKCSVFRFPGGSANSHADKGIIKAIKKEMSRRGFVWFDWNADGEDSIHKYISAEEIAANVFRCAKGKNEVVVLWHGAAGHSATVEALPVIIDGFIEQGYSFRLLSEMEKPMQY